MFLKKVGGRCVCVYGAKGAVDRKSLGTAALHYAKLGLNRNCTVFKYISQHTVLESLKVIDAVIVRKLV
jgi:hypothetical protein